MTSENEQPPFSDPLEQLDPVEIHRRDILLSRGDHPLSESDINELIINLIRLFKRNGTRRSLNQFHAHNLIRTYLVRQSDQSRMQSNPTDFEISPEQDPGLPPRLVQFGVGLALRVDAETTEPKPFEEIVDNLLEIKNWYSRRGGSPLPLDSPIADPYFGMIWRELTTLRHADGYQMIEKAYRGYKPWESEMEEILGFSIEDAVYYTRKIIAGIEEQLDGTDYRVSKWTPSFTDYSQKVMEIVNRSVWVSEKDLFDWCDESSRFLNFIDRLSVEPGSVSDFQTPADVNPLERAPFVNYESEYLLPLPRTLLYSLANTFYYDLIGSEYSGRFQLQFGDWLEEWTIDCLSKFYTQDEIIQNYTYQFDGEEVEGDILILNQQEPLVIECKGKKLRAETRKGNFGGIDTLKQDIKRGIGDAYRQADRLVSGVQSGEINQIRTQDGKVIKLDQADLNDAHRWLVLGESYGPLATRDFAKVLDINPLPYVCDIYDLQILSEVLETPDRLLHYIRRRIRQTEVQLRRPRDQYSTSKTFSPDEIDYLGVYKRNGWQFPIGAERITGAGDNLREETIDEILDNNGFDFMY